MQNQDIEQIGKLIDVGDLDQAESLVDEGLVKGCNSASLYYLKGRICMKRSDWAGSLENFRRSAALEPGGPAAASCGMVEDILNFYHKDLYNP